MQTVEIPPTQQTKEAPETVVSMEQGSSRTSSINGGRPFAFEKSKEKETLEETPEKTTTTIDVNASFNTSENFLDKNTSSVDQGD
ncbi:3570_t:CDS:2 [Funneliformis geosporum]|nr:3570_t:CDS:2 [Funneliformis geosporum]